MNTRNFLLTLLLVVELNVNAQLFKIESTEVIPERLGIPVLVMKNGSTVFVFDDIKHKQVLLRIFNSKRNLVVDKPLEFKSLAKDFTKRHYAKMVVTIKISGWSEENGKIVLGLFDEHYQEKYGNCMKYKITIDPQNGIVEDEKTTSENGGFHYSTITDTATNNYYVHDYQVKAKGEERGKLTLSYYASTAKKIGEIPFDYLGNSETKADVNSCINLGNGKLGALTLVSKENKEPKMILSIYDFTKNKLTNKVLFDVPDDCDIESSDITLVPNSDLINILYYIKTGAKSGKVYYQLLYQNIDYKKMEVYKAFTPDYEKLNDFVKTNCEIKKGYVGGFVYSTQIDKKGNIFSTRVKNVTSIYGKNVSTLNPELVGVTYTDINGKELNAWAFPFNNAGSAKITSGAYASYSDFSFKTICNKKGNFVFLNDLEKNATISLNEKPSFARITDECHAMVVTLTNTGQVKKDFLFGAPANKRQNKHADIANALYDEKTNSLVTIYYEGEGYKDNRVAWIKLD